MNADLILLRLGIAMPPLATPASTRKGSGWIERYGTNALPPKEGSA